MIDCLKEVILLNVLVVLYQIKLHLVGTLMMDQEEVILMLFGGLQKNKGDMIEAETCGSSFKSVNTKKDITVDNANIRNGTSRQNQKRRTK